MCASYMVVVVFATCLVNIVEFTHGLPIKAGRRKPHKRALEDLEGPLGGNVRHSRALEELDYESAQNNAAHSRALDELEGQADEAVGNSRALEKLEAPLHVDDIHSRSLDEFEAPAKANAGPSTQEKTLAMAKHTDTSGMRQNQPTGGSKSTIQGGRVGPVWVTRESALPSADSLMEVSDKIQQRKAAMTAPLSEDGYLSVVKLDGDELMSTFIRRLCQRLRLHVRDEGALHGLVPHFNGAINSQSFFALKKELLSIAAQPHTWLIEERHTLGTWLLERAMNKFWQNGSTAPLNQLGYTAAASLNSDEHMAQFVKRVVRDLDLHISDYGQLNGFVMFYSGNKSVQNFATMRMELIKAVRGAGSWLASGDSVPLNDSGYRSVANLANVTEMGNFIHRVAVKHGCKIVDESALARVAHSFGGTNVRSMALLEEEVRDSCDLSGTERRYGSLHDIVGEEGVLQISLSNSERSNYSSDALRSASIVPSRLPPVDGQDASSDELSKSCLRAGETNTNSKCSELDRSMISNLDDNPGCKSQAEQVITSSHHKALQIALLRNHSEWTAIIEGDVVPLHTGSFDTSFKEAWAKIPRESKFVRLNWCSSGPIRRKTYEKAGNFRLIKEMSGDDARGDPEYYVGGCTTSYIVHQSILKEVLGIFPCCCSIDCCLENQLFYAPPKKSGAKYRGQEILMNMDAWDSQDASFSYAAFDQGGIFARDDRDPSSLRLENKNNM